MAYTAAQQRATQKYIRESLKQITIRYKQDEFDSDILPAINASGLPMTTFIKQAVAEKIERDYPDLSC